MAADPAQELELRITPVRPEDLRAIHAITTACFDLPYTLEVLRDCLRRAGSGFVAARTRDDILGFSIATTPGLPRSLLSRAGELVLIAVAPSHQRHGIGQKLLEASLAYLRSLGMREVRLHVSVSNTGAIALYKRNGMRIVHVVKGYYQGNQDAYRMVGQL